MFNKKTNTNYKNIAVLRHGAIGDVINSLPMMKLLRNKFPEAKIVFFSAAYNRELLSYVREISQVYEFEFSKNFFSGFTLAKKLKDKYKLSDFDLFINLQPNWCTRNLGFSIARNSYEYHKSASRGKVIWQSFSDVALNEIVEVENSLNTEFPLIKLPLEVQREALSKAKELSSSKRKLALIIGAGVDRPHKAWPKERWIQFITQFNQTYKEWDILLIGAQREELISSMIVEALPEVNLINLVNKLTLAETAYALQLCEVSIGGDTGPIHLAASMGSKTICLFGPTSEIKHRPIKGKAIKSNFQCPLACKLNKGICSKANDENCMNSISSEMLMKELSSFIK